MGYSAYLKNTLKPLGIYELDTGLGASELNILGSQLDSVDSSLNTTLREMLPLTAQDVGLSFYESLFPGVFVPQSLSQRRTAVNCLLRLGETECSDQGLNMVLTVCGIPAAINESSTNDTVEVVFTEDAPSGDALDLLKQRIEAILPCHLDVVYI